MSEKIITQGSAIKHIDRFLHIVKEDEPKSFFVARPVKEKSPEILRIMSQKSITKNALLEYIGGILVDEICANGKNLHVSATEVYEDLKTVRSGLVQKGDNLDKALTRHTLMMQQRKEAAVSR